MSRPICEHCREKPAYRPHWYIGEIKLCLTCWLGWWIPLQLQLKTTDDSNADGDETGRTV